MTVRPAVVLARLAHLGSVLSVLDRLRALPNEARATDAVHQLAAERALQVAVEAIIDVGHHVLAGRGLPVPGTYREVVPAMASAGILEPSLAARLDGMAGLRNILVHDYVDVDPARVWLVIERHTPDLWAVHGALASIPELTQRHL